MTCQVHNTSLNRIFNIKPTADTLGKKELLACQLDDLGLLDIAACMTLQFQFKITYTYIVISMKDSETLQKYFYYEIRHHSSFIMYFDLFTDTKCSLHKYSIS